MPDTKYSEIEILRYPTGRFEIPKNVTAAQISVWIEVIEKLPEQMREILKGMSEEQLDTPYRPEGWTVKQLVHHVADSHLNSYIRFRWTLTENEPLIKTYKQDAWALLPDARNADVAISLLLLEALHARWTLLLRTLNGYDWQRKFFHPEWKSLVSLETTLALYAWHSKHHLAHIEQLKIRMNW